ncbi:hypothetical protein [Zooshikella harenae]|uniref:Uncharacterized protein n=1 Tax=Zooshikella harenae TaxID=2827238 RepID=A0ABS5ZJJ4_9GAMM|nr:hypothetical protein [Zooshikella harenae]MBU2714197.1 hypothetical protein [Zooshikella harenae]
MKLNIKSLLLFPLLSFSSFCSAAQFGSAYGDVIEIAAGGVGAGAPAKNLMYFTVSGTSTFATCANSSSPHFVINNEDGGKTMVSMLLAAKMAGKKIHVAGRGTCTYISGHEDVSLIYID